MSNEYNEKCSLFSYVRAIELKYKITFLFALFIGLISQGMGLFNKYAFNGDDVVDLFDVGATYSSGRWLLGILGKLDKTIFLDGNYSLSLLNGFLIIVLIGLSACLIVHLIRIESLSGCAIIGSIMVSFPVITSLIGGFMFTAPYYVLALFLGVLGVYFVCNEHSSILLWLCGVLFICGSLGIYQGFFPTILSLITMSSITYVFRNDDSNIKRLISHCISSYFAVVLSFILYTAISRVSLLLMQTNMSTYMGINTMGRMEISDFFGRVLESYKQFFYPSIGEYYSVFPGIVRYLYMFIILAGGFLIAKICLKKYKMNKGSVLLIVGLSIVFPLCTDFIFVMVSKHSFDIHSLMVYAHVLPFIFFIWLIENSGFRKQVEKGLYFVSMTILSFICFAFCRYDNKCYLKASITQQQLISYFTTLVTQIKSTENYSDEMPVAFINAGNIKDKSLHGFEELSDIKTLNFAGVESAVNQYGWASFLKTWCGYSPIYADENKYIDLDEVKEMPSYPKYGSIKMVDDVMVVKF